MESEGLPETRDASPRAASMVETLRALGYSLETAIADVIDNSITAGASMVDVTFEWHGRDSVVVISDDGSGMSDDEIAESMRPGTRSPLEDRDPSDLGRFGLGLKTASFSQCRMLTVISKREEGMVAFWTWDLDYVSASGRWNLLRTPGQTDEQDAVAKRLKGTSVVWQKMDRLVGDVDQDDEAAQVQFWQAVEGVRDHVAMVFHRYIEDPGPGSVSIRLNGRELSAWDPFLRGKPGTQPLATEALSGDVSVKPYVLPHHSKLDPDALKVAAGRAGWAGMQGFYVYRNRRLLVAGDWLGLFRREEHYKLVRLQVDIPNSTDQEWDIDVKKSRARPPGGLRQDLARIGEAARSRALQVYRSRGAQLPRVPESKDVAPVWTERVHQGRRKYEINRAHPSIATLDSGGPEWAALRAALRLIEETVPVSSIYYREASRPDQHASPLEGVSEDDVVSLMRTVRAALVAGGASGKEADRRLLTMEPFNVYPHLISRL